MKYLFEINFRFFTSLILRRICYIKLYNNNTDHLNTELVLVDHIRIYLTDK